MREKNSSINLNMTKKPPYYLHFSDGAESNIGRG